MAETLHADAADTQCAEFHAMLPIKRTPLMRKLSFAAALAHASLEMAGAVHPQAAQPKPAARLFRGTSGGLSVDPQGGCVGTRLRGGGLGAVESWTPMTSRAEIADPIPLWVVLKFIPRPYCLVVAAL